jgi:uncharacterized protein (DUF1501 family)
MAITRRQFLRRTCLATAGTFLAPGFFRNPFLQRALADTIGDRYFVVIFLDGGNDGLNTVVPYDNVGGLRTAYEAARGTGSGGLRLASSDLLVPSLTFNDPNTGTQLGFHPGLVGFQNLYDMGKLAVIQGCGYPDYNLSHDVSSTIWETGNPLGVGGFQHGWMGRYLAANYGASEIPGVTINDSVAGEFAQTSTSVLAVRRLRDFGFPYDESYESDIDAKRLAFLSVYAAASSSVNATAESVGASGLATLLSSESYPPLHSLYQSQRGSWDAQYSALNTGTARDLREVAKIINGVRSGVPNVNARFFEVRNGGYDTHSNQGTGGTDSQHYRLHHEVGDAVELFYNDCADMGVANKLCILVWSEFSRRIPQNDNGTDHGSQGPMFVIGGTVNGGVYGNHPNITPAALDDNGNTVYSQNPGDGFRSTDFRDVYGTVLKHWLNMPSPLSVLPLDSGNANDYWTVPDFDMGFV